MAMPQGVKRPLAQFTMVAQKIIYDPQRAKTLLEMVSTRSGVVAAVDTIIKAIGARRKVPLEIAPLLAVNIYLIIVDIARNTTGRKPSPEILKQTITLLLQKFSANNIKREDAQLQQEQQQSQQQPPQQQGLIAQTQGAAA